MFPFVLWLSALSGAKAAVIDPAESPARFRHAKTTTDAKVGRRAVVFDVPAGTRSFHALSLEDVPIDLRKYAGLAFWWKAKGVGLTSLTIKVWFPTLHEGRELVFPVWNRENQTAQEKKARKCLAFGTRDGVDFAVLDDSNAIADVTFVRTAALLNQNLIVFIDQVSCDRERTLDFAYHQNGTRETLPPGKPWQAPGKGPYRHLRAPTVRDASNGLVVSTRLDAGWSVSVVVAGGEKTEAVAATGPGIGGAHVQVPCLILRRRATETALAWAIALDGRPPRLEWVDEDGKPRAEATTVRVSAPGQQPVTLRAEPGRPDRIFTVSRMD